MARSINRLPASYKNLKPGMHCDGGCLYLQVSLGASNNRRLSWIFRYTLKGQKARDMGLGSVNDLTLAEARETARDYRKLVKQGIDPKARRDAERAKNLAANVAVMTFDQAAEVYIKNHRAGWSVVHAHQWEASLKRFASPQLGKMSVADVETQHVLKMIEPIWTTKPETASRVRGRIESVLGWATTAGYRRCGDNPARWKDHIENLLPPKGKVKVVRHQPSLAYQAMPPFVTELRTRQGMAAIALEFTILTCVRSLDVRDAKHADFDRVAKVWAIPSFTKTGRRHVVPLSDAALAVFDKAREIAEGIGGKVGRSEYAFPSDTTGARLSSNSMLEVVNRMGHKGAVTVHGARASFRTWALEQTHFPWELADQG